MIISLVILVIFAILAGWVIQTFFLEPLRMVLLVLVGVVVLVALVRLFGIIGPVTSYPLLK